MDCRFMPASQDWDRFVRIFNDRTQYAPYTMRLSRELVERRIEPFARQHGDLVLIAASGSGEGILHASLRRDGDWSAGSVHLLLANDNDAAQALLREAGRWFEANGMKQALAYLQYPNPYESILHGAEVYGWAGAYAAMNAFRRENYDVSLDVLVMSKDLDCGSRELPAMPGLELADAEVGEDELAWKGRVVVHVGGRQAGWCEYVHLKGISEVLDKGIGQFSINVDADLHGKQAGAAMLRFAEDRLRKRGVHRMILATNQELYRAVSFYRKMGYGPEPIRSFSFDKRLSGDTPAVMGGGCR